MTGPPLFPSTSRQRQLVLHEALAEKSQDLARMYVGALAGLSNTANPDRFPQAAHSLRELMEKIPSYIEVETRANRESLGVKVRELETHWINTVQRSPCYDGDTWSGNIDRHLLKLLQRLADFFEWFEQHNPRRRAETAVLLRRLDSSGRSLPTILESLEVQSWMAIREFFQRVAHHGTQPTVEEFNEWMEALERFLLDRLRPRTFADFDTIDNIILEGESNG